MSATVQFTKQLAFNLILHKLPYRRERGAALVTILDGVRDATLSYERQKG